MIGTYSRLSRGLFTLYGVLILSFLYMPLLGTALASFSKKRYVSFPISYVSKFFKIPLILYENNLVLGRANKYLLSSAKKILLAKTL